MIAVTVPFIKELIVYFEKDLAKIFYYLYS